MSKIEAEFYQSYCVSLGEPLKEYVIEAKRRKDNSIGSKEESFLTGYLCGIHRIITLMQQQAEAYDLPLNELGVDFMENDLM